MWSKFDPCVLRFNFPSESFLNDRNRQMGSFPLPQSLKNTTTFFAQDTTPFPAAVLIRDVHYLLTPLKILCIADLFAVVAEAVGKIRNTEMAKRIKSKGGTAGLRNRGNV